MLKWSFKREAHWMLWLTLPPPVLAFATVLWILLARLW